MLTLLSQSAKECSACVDSNHPMASAQSEALSQLLETLDIVAGQVKRLPDPA